MQNQRARLNDEMHVYKAHVKNGKFELEVPDLPEGAELRVQVEIVEEEDLGMTEEEHRNFLAEQYGLDPSEITPEKEQELLDDAIRQGIEDCEAGRVVSAEKLHEELRARRRDR